MNRKCQIFTPNDYVNRLLDIVNYTDCLYGKRVLENSCGVGNVLVVIVERYIDDCRKHGFTDSKIREGLEQDIFGVEIDSVTYNQCILNLDELIKRKGLSSVQWKVFNADYLKWDYPESFDYVIGNPPYITYNELTEVERDFVKKHFASCKKGKFDYCYAFIEKSLNCLAVDGKMAYLIPSSIFKTVFGANLRSIMKPYLSAVFEFAQDKMFKDALVKSAIIFLDKATVKDTIFRYQLCEQNMIEISRSNLTDKWFFDRNVQAGKKRFGDYFKVSHVVATLLNEAFVLKNDSYQGKGDYFICQGIKIEKSIIRNTATPRSLRYKREEKIIFPYFYDGDILKRYTQEQFIALFPGANSYLNLFRKKLDERKKEENALWFEYGRSQALNGLNRPKLLISTVVSGKPAVFLLRKDCIPYSGMYVVPREDNATYNLDFAKKLLENDSFIKYVSKVGIHVSGNSLRITSKDIENFMF